MTTPLERFFCAIDRHCWLYFVPRGRYCDACFANEPNYASVTIKLSSSQNVGFTWDESKARSNGDLIFRRD
jgi:hypothetical protein